MLIKKHKIFFLYPVTYSTFVREDDRILSQHYHLSKYLFRTSKKAFPLLFELKKLSIVSIFTLWKYKIIYCWFAGYHSLIPAIIGRLYGKKVVIAVGGVDAVCIPSIKFGVFWKKNLMTLFARKTYQLANLIIPVDQSLVESINYYADPSGKGYLEGIKHFVKKIKGNIQVVPTGYDEKKWCPQSNVNRKKSVITIGFIPDLQRFKLKGFDLLIEVASLVPDTEFYLIGLSENMTIYAKTISGNNVHLIGYTPNEKLPEIFSSHKVFAQFSMSEGLPNTLCEAMLCECIPVGSNVNGIPEAIGDCGYILYEKDSLKASELIRKALNADSELGINARKRIIEKYPVSKREKTLFQLLK